MAAPAMDDTERRLVELELRYTEQQAFIEELSGVLYEQQRLLETLEAEVKLLRRKLEGEPGVTEAGPVERPPHY
ncbi:MAG: SlyX family protein [Myxococcaceae bacterium]|nr:SlyX family protein [Myxococcaceae bacterium]MCI0673982.1 SlyX family protein [Myxococcaceae bacterium]